MQHLCRETSYVVLQGWDDDDGGVKPALRPEQLPSSLVLKSHNPDKSVRSISTKPLAILSLAGSIFAVKRGFSPA